MAVLTDLSQDASDKAAESSLDLSVDERIRRAEAFKDSGNQAFQRGEDQSALRNWHHALLYSAGINSFASLYGSKSTEEQNIHAAEVTTAVYNNLAACYAKQQRWDRAVHATTKALALSPKNVKALYRRARSYLELGRTTLAAKDVDLALDLRPDDPAVRALGERLVEAFDREERARRSDQPDTVQAAAQEDTE
ncbi:TPR-like protein [Testicularia cyperi]|uniref:TPR-like protein n=1 Tax=Testicularia cyperi TaxID=1882483 RepID=A0A317XUN7_9BASI|nr:TPR-like protein [Testicularia cyperi]